MKPLYPRVSKRMEHRSVDEKNLHLTSEKHQHGIEGKKHQREKKALHSMKKIDPDASMYSAKKAARGSKASITKFPVHAKGDKRTSLEKRAQRRRKVKEYYKTLEEEEEKQKEKANLERLEGMRVIEIVNPDGSVTRKEIVQG